MSAELQHLHRSWTLADLEALPDDGYRYEIIDGQLVVNPPPGAGHQALADALCATLRARGELAVTAVGLDVPAELGRTQSYVIPDVLVARERFGLDKQHFHADEVTLVAEVVSPGSRRQDRRTKPDLYAELGIARYVLVEPEQQRVRLFDLVDGEYAERDAGELWLELTRQVDQLP